MSGVGWMYPPGGHVKVMFERIDTMMFEEHATVPGRKVRLWNSEVVDTPEAICMSQPPVLAALSKNAVRCRLRMP